MIILLSPAKTMDFNPVEVSETSLPDYQSEAYKLVKRLRDFAVPELIEMMDISENLATLNVKRFKSFKRSAKVNDAKPALLAYKGDVYQGLEADDFNEEQLQFAQKHLRILSGLYGMLRPMDVIQPYRLEMGIPLSVNGSENLYAFWSDKLTRALKKMLKEFDQPYVINLASQEYSKAIHFEKLGCPVYDVIFKEWRNDKWQFVSYNAKRARGMLSRYIIQNGIQEIESIKGFSEGGYFYEAEMSDRQTLFFARIPA